MKRRDVDPDRPRRSRGRDDKPRRGGTPFDLLSAWTSFRASSAPCPRACGGILTMVVLPADRVYGLQCVDCGFPSQPFTVLHGMPQIIRKTVRPGEDLD
jgi:Zn ribbon nucleic-acid-binding protein